MIKLEDIPSPILLQGDATHAYRDPAVVYDQGVFHLFFTLVESEADGRVFLYLAKSTSRDLLTWSPVRTLSPRDQRLNYSSPGNVIRHNGQWLLCCQTYPRPNGEKYGNADSRIFSIASPDLDNWGEFQLLRVKGPDVPEPEMGRMIDPYLIEDRNRPDRWWCFFKQNGVSYAFSDDLKTWTFAGSAEAGENACVVADGDEYLLFHSPKNGIGVKRSADLKSWQDEGVFYLGQREWPWAQGRITAGFVLDLRCDPSVGKALLFFHGSGPEDERTMFDVHASLGLAWSDSLSDWIWPGKGPGV